MRPLLLVLLAALAGCAAPHPDARQVCTLEKVTELPVTFRRGVPLTRIALDGRAATMILDTGAAASLLTQEAAARFGLPPDQTRLYLNSGIGGMSYARGVRVGRMELGAANVPDQAMVVGPFALRGWDAPAPDGLLGNDVLQHFDVELDLPNSSVTLWRRRPCLDAVPPWSEAWSVLRPPPDAPHRNLVYVPVELDGRPFVGYLDSGSMVTVVARRTADALGVKQAMMAGDQAIEIQGAAPADAPARVHRFDSMRIGNEQGAAPPLVVAELPAEHGDLLVGVGYLRARRVWISYATRVVFVGAAQGPVR